MTGQLLVSPLQENVGVGQIPSAGSGIAQEEPGVFPRLAGGCSVGQNQVDAAGIVPAEIVHQLGEGIFNEQPLHGAVPQEILDVFPLGGQQRFQRGIEHIAFPADQAPAGNHGLFQGGLPVFNQVVVDGNGVLRHGLLGSAGQQRGKEQHALAQHHQQQRQKQQHRQTPLFLLQGRRLLSFDTGIPADAVKCNLWSAPIIHLIIPNLRPNCNTAVAALCEKTPAGQKNDERRLYLWGQAAIIGGSIPKGGSIHSI